MCFFCAVNDQILFMILEQTRTGWFTKHGEHMLFQCRLAGISTVFCVPSIYEAKIIVIKIN